MILQRFCLIVGVIFISAGCTHVMYKKPPVNEPSDDATIRLAEAATSVNRSMREMERIDKVVTPPHRSNKLNIPSSYPLWMHASVDWSGPIREITCRVAKAAGYHCNVLGKAPAIPVLISITCKNKTLREILRDIDYQAGKKASIHVYPHRKIVELRYAKV